DWRRRAVGIGQPDQGHAFAEQGRVSEFAELIAIKEDGQMQLPRAQLPHEIAGELLGEFELDQRKALSDGAQQGKGERARYAVGNPEHYPACRRVRCALYTYAGILHLSEYGGGMSQEHLACLGQLRPAP